MEVAHIIDCWLYEVLPQREIVIVTYGVKRRDQGELRLRRTSAVRVFHASRNRSLADTGRLLPFNTRMVRKPQSAPVKLR